LTVPVPTEETITCATSIKNMERKKQPFVIVRQLRIASGSIGLNMVMVLRVVFEVVNVIVGG
jgi:hypothetical protein